jgi:thiamine-monophosphate kinase
MNQIGAQGSLTESGEYSFHRQLASLLNKNMGDEVIGDDAALLSFDSDNHDAILVSTDRLASGVPAQLRAKLLVAQALSDIICMGGTPVGILIAMQWPRSSTAAQALDFIAEADAEASRYGCHVVGGDTKEGAEFAAVGTAVGFATKRDVIRRTPVEDKDLMVVTSTGARPWGARWANQLATSCELDLGRLRQKLAEADLTIALPLVESRVLAEGHLVRAGMDLSDGIGASLKILSMANSIGFDVHPAALDELVDAEAGTVVSSLGIAPRALALSPGYMWENIYAVDPSQVGGAMDAVATVGGKLTVIGEASRHISGVLYGGEESAVIDAASDEKFKSFAWENRVPHWLETMQGNKL